MDPEPSVGCEPPRQTIVPCSQNMIVGRLNKTPIEDGNELIYHQWSQDGFISTNTWSRGKEETKRFQLKRRENKLSKDLESFLASIPSRLFVACQKMCFILEVLCHVTKGGFMNQCVIISK